VKGATYWQGPSPLARCGDGGRATVLEVHQNGRKIWGRWVEDPGGPCPPIYWQWCREEGVYHHGFYNGMLIHF
jgi:hypothetical protein